MYWISRLANLSGPPDFYVDAKRYPTDEPSLSSQAVKLPRPA